MIIGKLTTIILNLIDLEVSTMEKDDIRAVISICLWMLMLSLSAAISIFIIIVAAITAYHW